jgi:hypothetical protein
VRKPKTTVHGQDEVGAVSVEEYRHAKGEATGQTLVDAMFDSPLRGVKIERPRIRSRVRSRPVIK